MPKIDYTAKVDALLNAAAAMGFTERDFADLAIAAADQSGVSAEIQQKIANLIDGLGK